MGKDGIGEAEIIEFKGWLRERELAENTINSYCTAIKQFGERYTEPSKENGLRWKNELLLSGDKPSTVNLRLCALNAYCRMLNNGVSIKRIKVHNRTAVDNVISANDYIRLLDGLERDKNACWYWNVRLLASTGARVSEYIRLKKADLDQGYAELYTKGKIRRIYLPRQFCEESAAHYSKLAPHDCLVRTKSGKAMTARGVSQALKRFAVKYDIDERCMHPHAFRHFFAMEFMKTNGNLSLLSDILGHSSVATTAIYTRMTQRQQIDAINDAVRW